MKYCFGINYDSGNSASLGFDAAEEWASYSSRILNVHIKDRLLAGSTVPLGEGNVDFSNLFLMIHKYNYQGYVLPQKSQPEYLYP